MVIVIEHFVDFIATKAGVDPATAETAIGTILSAIQQEGDATKVGQLFNQIPGAADLAQKHAVVVGSGGGVLGSLSGLASSVVGKDAGVLVAAIGQLERQTSQWSRSRRLALPCSPISKRAQIPHWRKEVVDFRTKFASALRSCGTHVADDHDRTRSPLTWIRKVPKRTFTASRVARHRRASVRAL